MATTTTVRKDTKKEEIKPIPKGASILSQNITTDVKEIENGYLITKRTETRYRLNKDSGTDYHYEDRSWYSKEDPLTINTKDKALADAFEE